MELPIELSVFWYVQISSNYQRNVRGADFERRLAWFLMRNADLSSDHTWLHEGVRKNSAVWLENLVWWYLRPSHRNHLTFLVSDTLILGIYFLSPTPSSSFRGIFFSHQLPSTDVPIVKRERRTTKQTSSDFSLTTNGWRCLLSVLLLVTSLASVGKQQHRTMFDHPQSIIFFFSRNGNHWWTLLMQWETLLMRGMKTFACWFRIVTTQRKRKERTLRLRWCIIPWVPWIAFRQQLFQGRLFSALEVAPTID